MLRRGHGSKHGVIGQRRRREEEEDEGKGKWEDVSAAIEFAVGHNGYGGGGGPVEIRES